MIKIETLYNKLQGSFKNCNRNFQLRRGHGGVHDDCIWSATAPFTIRLADNREFWVVQYNNQLLSEPVKVPFPRCGRSGQYRWGETLSVLSEAVSTRYPRWFDVEITKPPGRWVRCLTTRPGETYRQALARWLPNHEHLSTIETRGLVRRVRFLVKGEHDATWKRF